MTTETTSETSETINAETVIIHEFVCTITKQPTPSTNKMGSDGHFYEVPGVGIEFALLVKFPGINLWMSDACRTRPSREAALAFAHSTIERHLASEIPHLPTRAEYEAACVRQGYTPLSDAAIAASTYSMEHGNYSMPQYSTEESASMKFAQARYRALEAERDASPEIASPEIASPEIASPEIASPEIASPEIAAPGNDRRAATALVACPNCGMTVAKNLLMYASLGMACPNCYDDTEDEN